MTRIRAVIFDLGHTIWDIESHPEALEQAYVDMHATLVARIGGELPTASEFQRAVYDVLVDASQTYFSDGPSLDQPPSHVWVDRGCRALGIELDDALLREITPALFATEHDALICADGTVDALVSLHGDGYALGCITNTLADTAAIRAMLRLHGVEALMNSVVVSADEGWRKPHASLFKKAMRELDVEPFETVFVGDSPPHDIAGAKACGMHAVLTQQYVARPYEGFEPQPDAIITHVRELPAVIARLESSG
ncbi:MAG TPA: HAD family hydrolase [Dehalococcoidia bacterium]